MALDTVLTNVIIEGNTFDYGVFTPDGNPSSTPVTYGYYTCVLTSTDSVIKNNYFSGTSSGLNGTRLWLLGGSTLVTGNTFIRGNITIPSYILSNSSFDQIITNNIFDGHTIDGTNETLVIGLTPNSIYEKNKNQTGYMAIQKHPYMTSSVNFNPPPRETNGEYAKYVDEANFGVGSGVLNSAREGIAINYLTPFVQVGDAFVGGGFDVQNGNATVDCNLPVTGSLTTGAGMMVQFDNNNDFYVIISPVTPSSGSPVTQFTLNRPYNGLTNSNANAVFYSPTGDPPLTNIATPSAPFASFNFSIDVNELLPTNVTILSLVVGIWANSATSIIGGQFFANIFASTPANYQLSSLTGTMADTKNYTGALASGVINPGFVVGTGLGQVTPATLANATQYVSVDMTSPANSTAAPFFVTGKGRVIRFNYTSGIQINSPGQAFIYESPLIVKYRW